MKYLDELKKHRKCGNASLPVMSIGTKNHGRPLTLGDLEVQKYVTALRQASVPISGEIVLAAAEGIVIAKDGGHICLTRGWVNS